MAVLPVLVAAAAVAVIGRRLFWSWRCNVARKETRR